MELLFMSAIFEGRFLAATLSLFLFVSLTLVSFFGGLVGYNYITFPIIIFFAGLCLLAAHDLLQARHAILRNYPVIGHFRFLLEKIRPELRQYFFESEVDGMPFSRTRRAVVYQRAKEQLDKRPFGTHEDVYAEGYEWLLHSIRPLQADTKMQRLIIGNERCTQPYSASILNISAMSFGALSPNAIRALNLGAKMGEFAHDTGEGSISPYHREFGGDLIWEIGSGYFGCRNKDGHFSDEKFTATAKIDQVKMIEIKLSQGAKPGHGGVLPAAKVTPEIAEIRGVELGVDCISPACHSAFSSAPELVQFIEKLRILSGGKPIGFKICIGHKAEFQEIVDAIVEAKIAPDFIVIDGKEGGTGAAPAEFLDHVGMPLRDALIYVHTTLVNAKIRDQIKLGCAGKIITGFDMARCFALGADWCNVARGFMFAIGCIQAQTCHTGMCPTGVATQDPRRQRAIDVSSKALRVKTFHKGTIQSFADIIAAAGLESPRDITPRHILRRTANGSITTLEDIYLNNDIR
jgi:glutamate synthase domain-containing protein 2